MNTLQIEQSVKKGYLPENWQELNEKPIELTSGFFTMPGNVIVTESGNKYHNELDCNDFIYDDINENYIDEDESIVVFGRRGCQYYTIDTTETIEFRGNLYLPEYLSDNGIVLDGNGHPIDEDDAVFCVDAQEYYHADYCTYDENTEEYYYDEENIPTGSIWGYDSGEVEKDFSKLDNDGSKIIFGFGMEIEKNEMPSFQFDKVEIYEKTGCVLEKDSSVPDGFELKTAIYNLFSPKTEKRLKEIEQFANVKNVEGAGGHIGFSCNKYNDIELLNKVKAFLPLIYAMHKKRIGNSYCTAKKVNQLVNDRDKFQSIRLRGNYIEFRIFSSVKTFETVKFRLNLFRIIAENLGATFNNVLDMCLNTEAKLYQLLRSDVYEKPEKFIRLINDALEYNKVFGDETLTQSKIKQIENKLNQLQCA